MIELTELRDGGQDPASVATEIASFLSPAKKSLELALYDVHLESEHAAPIHAALTEVLARNVRVRLVYNVEFGKEIAVPRPPISRPELVEALPVETRGVPGVPDLMHHKYVVRDGEAVLTGSTNWTDDSWAREENLIAIVRSEELAARYQQNFEELWQKRDVEHSGHVDSAPIEIEGHCVRPWFAPGHGEALAHRIARRLGQAKRRIRIASPVLTSGPILGTLAELSGNHARDQLDIAGVLDATQIAEVIQQWRAKPQVGWKEPALRSLIAHTPWNGKRSTPWTPESVHDFMHAKIVVADDAVFFGSFNLSRSGERNAENMLEIVDAELAERLAAFIDEIRGRYPQLELPGHRDDRHSRRPD
jgi:phosphatidylserine/phosphatidylglycerophosphate/cardiolipin synthase-like enzyme